MDRRNAIASALGLVCAGDVVAAHAVPDPGTAQAAMTELERAAGLNHVDTRYLPGDVRRYGALSQPGGDDAPAWRAALATGHTVRGGGAECSYRLSSAIKVTRPTLIDLEGATVVPVGNTQAFVRTPPAPTAQSLTIEGTEPGSRTVRLQSAEGFRQGQWFCLSLDDHRHDPFSYPPNWTRITTVTGNVVELEFPLLVNYGRGQAKAMSYDPSLMIERFECVNGIFDGSESTFDVNTGQALRIGAVERVLVRNCEFRHYASAAELTCPVEIFTVIDAVVDQCRFSGGVSNFNACDMQGARSAQFTNNIIDGAHFGCNITRVDAGLFSQNTLQGRRLKEGTQNLPKLRSVRGLKAFGCATIRVLGNYASDYESPIKVEACFRYDISHNFLMNAGLGPASGQIALNVGSIAHGTNMRCGTIIGNHVETCGGIGIGVTSDVAGGVLITNNIVRSTQGSAIHVGVANATIMGNRIENWGLRSAGDPAIHFGPGATVADNRFANEIVQSVPCIAAIARGDGARVMRDNVSETQNPLNG